MWPLLIPLLACATVAQAQDSTLLFWSGALTPSSITVKARMSSGTDPIRLAYCAWPCLDGLSYSSFATADSSDDRVVAFELDGLQPHQAYLYRFEVNGILDTAAAHVGRFRTPHEGPCNFSFVVGSCNGTSTHPVWEAMHQTHPLLFLSTGDLHYRDPNSIDVEQHRAPYREDVLGTSSIREFLHKVPIAYVWDDHDFCGNGSDGSSIGKASAARAYREYVPHYPLHHATSVHQSFTIGRVHFILSDLRSSKGSEAMMDIGQFTWLLGEFLYARDHGLVAAWVSPLTWNSVGYPENWACQPDERTAINDFLFDQQVKDLFILSGDAHMLAIDDGANADFSSGHDLRYHYPIFQAAALSRTGSYKGGNFNQGGVHPNPNYWNGQFGEVRVEDDGDDICITFSGWRTDSMSTTASLVDTYSFCRTPEHVGVPEALAHQPAYATLTAAGLEFLWPDASGPGSVQLFDAAGRALLSERTSWTAGHARIPRTGLPPGLLIVRLSTIGQACMVRIMVP
ncbi:MAG: hypothetical protein IPL52_07505 [Flavobacteriales bacterium]|nr:hypothetical protein [Flavobacteriales bacterium]